MIPKNWEKVSITSLLENSNLRNSSDEHSHEDLRAVNKFHGMIPMKERVYGKSTERCKIVKKDWFAYNPMRLNIGSICQWKENNSCIVSPDYVVFKCKNGRLRQDYMAQFVQSNLWKFYVKKAGAGSVRVRIYFNDLTPLKIPLPPIPEQQKIAQILDSWDKAIYLTEKLIQTKNRRKKGLMHQLLMGKRRFGEFIKRQGYQKITMGRIPKDWKITKLSKCIAGRGTYGINAPSTDFCKNLPVYLRITDIDENGRLIKEGMKCVNHPDFKKYILEPGDIVFARTGNTTGKTYLHTEKNGQLVYAGFLIKFTPDSNTLNPNFLKFFTETALYWNWVQVMSSRSGQPGINSSEYETLTFPLPSLSEQNKIAAVLIACDKEIELLNQKLEALKRQKKGLMQKLLTGQVRVKVAA